MVTGRAIAAIALAWLAITADHYAASTGLSFEDRVAAQRAIERVRHSGLVDARRPFEETVTLPILEEKVRTYLQQSVALESFWKTPLTSEALERELTRIARATSQPDRLEEIYAALGNDRVLILETFVRASLANRLARSFFSTDERIHGTDATVAAVAGASMNFDGTAGEKSWDDWWRSARGDFPASSARQIVATPGSRIPSPTSHDVASTTCPEEGSWSPFGPLPNGMAGHVAVWTGTEMIVWGGHKVGGYRYDPLIDTWTSISTIGSPAGSTDGSVDLAAVWTGALMLVWDGAAENGGRYDPSSDTWEPMSRVAAPSSRLGFSDVWTGREWILWGGFFRGRSPLSTGARYDPATDTWQPTTLLGAPRGERQAALWTGREMVVWGGSEWESFPSDNGRYDPATDTWIPISRAGAPISSYGGHRLVWDGHEMLVWDAYGWGLENVGRYNPVTNTWRPMSHLQLPGVGGAAVWNGHEMLVYKGNGNGARYDPVSDTWQRMTSINAPTASNQSAVWTGTHMIVWGGDTDGKASSRGGRYDPASDAWTPTVGDQTTRERNRHLAAWTGNEFIVWGGMQGGGDRYDALTAQWTPLPSAQIYQFGQIHWTGEEILIWSSQGGLYSSLTDTWKPFSLMNAGSFLANTVWTGNEMIAWGGCYARGSGGGDLLPVYPGNLLEGPYCEDSRVSLTNAGARYDPTADHWAPMTMSGAPSPRWGYHAHWTGKELIVWGGRNPDDPSTSRSGGVYDPRSDAWRPISIVGAPPEDDFRSAWSNGEMLLWNESGGWAYTPESDSWRTIAASPSAAMQGAVVSTGTKVIVWGGKHNGASNEGVVYDPVQDTWEPTHTAGAPLPRWQHSAVWTGQSMIVWGGQVPAPLPAATRTGGIYAFPTDGDLDGFAPCAGDCDDARAAVHPDAVDLPGNDLDENCDGMLVCDPDAAWRAPRDFLRCVAAECRRLVRDGVLEARECRGDASRPRPGAPATNNRRP